MPNYLFAQLDGIDAVDCPCGLSRRAFTDDSDQTASVHLVDISEDARPHYGVELFAHVAFRPRVLQGREEKLH